MRKISKFLVLSAILAGIFGATFQKSKNVVKTEAAIISKDVKLYLEPGVWTTDDKGTPWFAAYFFGDGEAWFEMSNVDDRYMVQMDLEKNFTKVIFIRMKNDTTIEDHWDAKWNQTEDLVYNGTDNVFQITGWGGEKSTGTWKTVEGLGNDPEPPLPPLPAFTPTVEGIDNSKVRIWLDRSGHYDSGYQFTMKIGETYYQPTGYVLATHAVPKNSGRWFAYYDMPITAFNGGPNIELVIFLVDEKEVLVIPAGVYTVGDNSKLWKVNYDEDDKVWSVSKGATIDKVIPEFIGKVLEGYLTCSSSAENGYNAFPLIEANFINGWNISGTIGGHEITDYAGTGTAGYGSLRGEGAKVDAFVKYKALESMYNNGQIDGADFGTKINESRNTTGVALLVLTLGIALFGGFYFLYKKKFVIR